MSVRLACAETRNQMIQRFVEGAFLAGLATMAFSVLTHSKVPPTTIALFATAGAITNSVRK